MSCFFSSPPPIFLWFVFATLNDSGQRYEYEYNGNNKESKPSFESPVEVPSIISCFSPDEFLIMSNTRLGICFHFCCSGGYVCLKGSKYGLCRQAWPSHCSADCFAPQRLIKLPISSLHRFITFLSLLKRQRFSLLHWCIKFSPLAMIWLSP